MHDKYYFEVLQHLPAPGDCAVPSSFVSQCVYGSNVNRSQASSVAQRLRQCLYVGWAKPLDNERPIAYQLTDAGRMFVESYPYRSMGA